MSADFEIVLKPEVFQSVWQMPSSRFVLFPFRLFMENDAPPVKPGSLGLLIRAGEPKTDPNDLTHLAVLVRAMHPQPGLIGPHSRECSFIERGTRGDMVRRLEELCKAPSVDTGDDEPLVGDVVVLKTPVSATSVTGFYYYLVRYVGLDLIEEKRYARVVPFGVPGPTVQARVPVEQCIVVMKHPMRGHLL